MPEARRGKKRILLYRFHSPIHLVISISNLQNYEAISVCCFKPSSLWYYVLSALGNKYNKIIRRLDWRIKSKAKHKSEKKLKKFNKVHAV
jgi:hypothetical protein